MGIAYNTMPSPTAAQDMYDASNALPVGIGSSAYDSFRQGYVGASQGADILFSKLNNTPVDSSYATTLQAIKLDQDRTPDSWEKTGVDWVANQVGTALNPYVAPLTIGSIFTGGIAGGIAGKAIGEGVSALTDIAANTAEETATTGAETATAQTAQSTSRFSASNIAAKASALTAEQAGTTLGKSVGFMEGQNTIPQVAQNYNPETGKVNGMMRSLATNLGYGVAFGVGELGLGLLFKKGVQAEIESGEPHQVVNGKSAPNEKVFTPQENELLKAHQNGAIPEDINDMSHDVLNKAGVETDRVSDTANMPLLRPQDIDNIAKTFPYEMASQLGIDNPRSDISDFIAKTGLDKATSNEGLISALEGHVMRMEEIGASDTPELAITKAILAYAHEGPQANVDDMTDAMAHRVNEKALGEQRVEAMEGAIKRSDMPIKPVATVAEQDRADTLLTAARAIPKVDRAFSEDATRELINRKKVEGGKDLFNKAVDCMMGSL